jgi:hypothetical protein
MQLRFNKQFHVHALNDAGRQYHTLTEVVAALKEAEQELRVASIKAVYAFLPSSQLFLNSPVPVKITRSRCHKRYFSVRTFRRCLRCSTRLNSKTYAIHLSSSTLSGDLDRLFREGNAHRFTVTHLRNIDTADMRFDTFDDLVAAVRVAELQSEQLRESILGKCRGPRSVLLPHAPPANIAKITQLVDDANVHPAIVERIVAQYQEQGRRFGACEAVMAAVQLLHFKDSTGQPVPPPVPKDAARQVSVCFFFMFCSITLAFVNLAYLAFALNIFTLYFFCSFTLPYPTLPHLTLFYFILPYLTLPYLTLPYHTIPYLTLP